MGHTAQGAREARVASAAAEAAEALAGVVVVGEREFWAAIEVMKPRISVCRRDDCMIDDFVRLLRRRW